MQTRRPTLLVVGCGAIGGVVAGHLAQAGHDVTVLTPNEAIAAALEGAGVRVHGRTHAGPVAVKVCRKAETLGGPFDAALLATQPPQVEQAARDVLPWLLPDSPLVCFQNGLCEERLRPLVSPERIYGAVVSWGASMTQPGLYERTSHGGFVLGRLDGGVDGRLEHLASLLRSVGPTQITSNLGGARWSKLAINCAVSSLGTLGGDRLGPLLRHRVVRRLALEIMTEVVAVAQAAGRRLEKLSGTVDLTWLALGVAERKGQAPLRLALKHALLLAVGARYRRLRSSMLAALERGRPAPVAFLNGEVCLHGDALGVPTPLNRAVVLEIGCLEAGTLRPSWETLRAFARRCGLE